MNAKPFSSMLLFLAGAILVIGCSKSNQTADVSGTVTYHGAPVPGGELVFHTASGVYSTGIQSDGSYSLAQVPSGDAVVTINTENLNPSKKTPAYLGQKAAAPSGNSKAEQAAAKMGKSGYAPGSTPGSGAVVPPKGAKAQASSTPAGAEQEKAPYVKIPKDYSDQTKSKLKVSVSAGLQTINLELND